MADLGLCDTADHDEPVPAVVTGAFRAPWWAPGRSQAARYCGRCAYLSGVELHYFTPTDPSVDLRALAPADLLAAFDAIDRPKENR